LSGGLFSVTRATPLDFSMVTVDMSCLVLRKTRCVIRETLEPHAVGGNGTTLGNQLPSRQWREADVCSSSSL
jgi:hypothetical protein